jgi:hypothetical protein
MSAIRHSVPLLLLVVATARAENEAAPPPALPAPTITAVTDAATDPADTVHGRYTTRASWEPAGYNNTEVVYHIFIASSDSRILKCTTTLKASFIENGQSYPVADRQMTTVFPGQEAQVGNWLGMDQQAGASYAITCRAM